MRESPIIETKVAHGPLLISQQLVEAQCVALGIFVNVGSRDEPEAEAGIAHALEHMLFKGTETLSVRALSETLDLLGGNANAFTGRERTCFYMTTLHEDWRRGLGILIDMMLHAEVPEDEWLRERNVILSEMAMVEDSPEEWVFDQHMRALFPTSSIGRPTLGNRKSLARITRTKLKNYLAHHYRPPQLLVAAAGRIGHDELADALTRYDWPQASSSPRRKPASMASGVQLLPRDIEQAYVAVSYPGLKLADTDRPVAWAANQILGGGMSSHLFRKVREELGLAYSIDSSLTSFSDGGVWTVSCATDPGRLRTCIDVIRETVGSFASGRTDSDELARALRQLRTQMRMSMDSVESQMLRLGSRFDEKVVQPISYWLDRTSAVDVNQVDAWKASHLHSAPLWTVCAPAAALKNAEGCLHL